MPCPPTTHPAVFELFKGWVYFVQLEPKIQYENNNSRVGRIQGNMVVTVVLLPKINVEEKTFMGSSVIIQFVKIFSLDSFLLYM